MGQQVARHTAAGRRRIETPQSLATLRHIGRDGPILQEVRTEVEDASQAILVDQPLGQRNGRDATIVVPHHVRHARFLDSLAHRLPIGGVNR